MIENIENADLHMHSIVSDGEMEPDEILREAVKLGIKKLSITDHDSVGAYKNFDYDLFKLAQELQIKLISGGEFDCLYQGKELHLLGYEIDVNNQALTEYLMGVKRLRKLRILEMIEGINKEFGKDILDKTKILRKHIDTLMKPHAIRPLLGSGKFKSYRDASVWVSEKIKIRTKVEKPPAGEMIRMISEAGGCAVIAHPAFPVLEERINLQAMIKDLIEWGLKGVEYYYPYNINSKHGFNLQELEVFKSELNKVCRKNDLFMTRGSDSHTLSELKKHNKRNKNNPVS
jgi:predicted metal-dependent phosphoesterase TrpH